MKTTRYLITALLVAGLLSCAEESPFEPDFNPNGEVPTSQSGGSTASIGELTSFAIAVDSTALSESETIDSSDEDYIENNTFDNEIKIDFYFGEEKLLRSPSAAATSQWCQRSRACAIP